MPVSGIFLAKYRRLSSLKLNITIINIKSDIMVAIGLIIILITMNQRPFQRKRASEFIPFRNSPYMVAMRNHKLPRNEASPLTRHDGFNGKLANNKKVFNRTNKFA